MTPRPILPAHHAAILRNNRRYVHWLSPLDESALVALLGKAHYAKQLRDGDAVLIGYDAHSSYRHKNVNWLCARFDSAFYIDRVIVGEAAQGQGVGRILYEDIIAHARAGSFKTLVCEVNTDPDNPDSHAFHLRLGFRPVGEERFSGGKAVRYTL